MSGSLTKIEKIITACLSLNSDTDIVDYLRTQELTTVEGIEVYQKLGVSKGLLESEDYVHRLKTSDSIPFFKKAHEGVFDHYLSTLTSNPNFTVDAVESIKKSVFETRLRMELREPLQRANSYGLVLGRIQSGKTAHLIGTVLHAIDSNCTDKPFDTIIILSGLIDDLRIQTRDRFKGVLDSYSGTKIELLPGRDKDLNSSNTQDLDHLRAHLKVNQHNSSILVVKKNHHILESILKVLEEKPYYKNKKFLIIDDEADHASMDTNAETYEMDGDVIDENPSLTNKLLRKIVKLLTSSNRCWYIGYTATPYANLLMMPHSDDSTTEFGLPLFPRDFLHALPKPEGHLDNEYYFSTPEGNDHIQIRTAPESESIEEEELISELFHRHLLTQIIKQVKGLNKHHTTLVHTDITVQEHNRYVESFNGILKQITEDKKPNIVVMELIRLFSEYSLEKKWEDKTIQELEMLKKDWTMLMTHIRKIKIVEVNRRPQSSEEENTSQDLEYNRGTIKRSYIAVGGTRLSRGLTLEGLTTTWFSRAAATPVYDTMLQMARWCGYRSGYGELVKIFTTDEIRDYYRHITEVEKDIRHQIEILPPDNSPMDTLVWIKEHSGMEVTAKMPAQYSRTDWGEVSQPNFWSYETPYFGDNPEDTSKMIYEKLTRLITRIGGGSKITDTPLNGNSSFKLKMNVENDKIKDFIKSYLSGYGEDEISKAYIRLNQIFNTWKDSYKWNVAIHTPANPGIVIRDLKIGLVQRKTELERPTRFSIIQGSSQDIGVDIPPGELRRQPLLLIYLINPASKVKHAGITQRVFDFKLITPAIGIGISLPNEMIGDGGLLVARKK